MVQNKELLTIAIFLYPAKCDFFLTGYKYFFVLNVIFCLLKYYHPMQKMKSVVIDGYKFGHFKNSSQLAFFGNFCTNT